MRSKSTLGKAPIGNFISFLVMLGWEGPLGLYIGFRDGAVVVIIIGTIITLLLWSFGWWIARDFIRYIFRQE